MGILAGIGVSKLTLRRFWECFFFFVPNDDDAPFLELGIGVEDDDGDGSDSPNDQRTLAQMANAATVYCMVMVVIAIGLEIKPEVVFC